MLHNETPDNVLEEYTKQRCDEIKSMYNNLKGDIMKLVTVKTETEKFELIAHISNIISKVSYEHIDTLDRYLYAYEANKRLENVIFKLKNEKEEP